MLTPLRQMVNNVTKRQVRSYWIQTINQSVDAYRETFGANPKKLGPGLTFGLPMIHRLRKVDMREGALAIRELNAYTKDNVPVIASLTLFYAVKDSFKALYNVQNYISGIQDMGTSSIRTIIGRFDYDQITSDRNSITSRLVVDIGNSIDQWGCACTRAELQDFRPQSKEVQRQLELQMEAERRRRENELISQALINTSEAEKRQQILKSEGQLISNTNLAEGEYILAAKKAEAEKYSIDNYTTAICNQLEKLTQATGSQERAVKVLLETTRMQNMDGIARGPNNKIYFVPSEQGNLIPTIQTLSESLKN